jgi:hypothetical protein
MTDASVERSFDLPPTARLKMRLPLLPEEQQQHPAFQRAQSSWKTATTSLANRKYEQAAQEFMNVADILSVDDGGSAQMSFTACRCIAYENAGAIWLGLNLRPLFRSQLRAAQRRDPACQHSISDMLKTGEPNSHKLIIQSSTVATR